MRRSKAAPPAHHRRRVTLAMELGGWGGGGRRRKARCFWKPMLAAAGSKLAMDPVNSSSEGLKKQDDVAHSVQAFEAHIGI
jgi:hypothetical protein